MKYVLEKVSTQDWWGLNVKSIIHERGELSSLNDLLAILDRIKREHTAPWGDLIVSRWRESPNDTLSLLVYDDYNE